jgi:hypothetical protein
MSWLNRLYLGTRVLPGAILLGGLLFGAWVWQIHRSRRGVDVSGWDIPQLVNHLNTRGLPVRLVFTKKDGITRSNAFLTTTDLGFESLNVLPRGKKYNDEWRGVVYSGGPTRASAWTAVSSNAITSFSLATRRC